MNDEFNINAAVSAAVEDRTERARQIFQALKGFLTGVFGKDDNSLGSPFYIMAGHKLEIRNPVIKKPSISDIGLVEVIILPSGSVTVKAVSQGKAFGDYYKKATTFDADRLSIEDAAAKVVHLIKEADPDVCGLKIRRYLDTMTPLPGPTASAGAPAPAATH